MTKRHALTLLLLAATTLAAGGCSMLQKSAKPKENPSIAGENEEALKQRWIDRRTAELVAQGTDATAARTQAADEFREKFAYLGAAKK